MKRRPNFDPVTGELRAKREVFNDPPPPAPLAPGDHVTVLLYGAMGWRKHPGTLVKIVRKASRVLVKLDGSETPRVCLWSKVRRIPTVEKPT